MMNAGCGFVEIAKEGATSPLPSQIVCAQSIAMQGDKQWR